jgi:surface polysaccharide O-acyltransferase-like enzyme
MSQITSSVDLKQQVTKDKAKRPHIYELDPMRACTAFSVVAVHVLAFTVLLNQTELGVQIQNAVVVTFHFTREVFLFVTAFALVYVYNGRVFPFVQFWKKRGSGVLLPYVVWSIIYVLVNVPARSVTSFVQTALFDVLTGNASYQLYYILLTLQFYLIFPLFLLFLRRVAHHPWIVLGISLVLQVLLFYVDFHVLQSNTAALPAFWQVFAQYQDRFVLVYQFYFVLGGLAALYFQQVRAFLLRHGKLVVGVFTLLLVALWLHFALQVQVYKEPLSTATSVLQPIMVFYSVAIIAFALWLACHWAMKIGERSPSRRIWSKLSDASFGVYLVHALVLSFLLRLVVPAMPSVWPVAIRVMLTWLLTVGGATAWSLLLMNIPVASRLVGRAGPQRKAAAPRRAALLDKPARERIEEKSRNPVQQAQRIQG